MAATTSRTRRGDSLATVTLIRVSLLWLWCCSIKMASAYDMCPDLCTCDNHHLKVTCIKSELDSIPNTLNPSLQTLIFKYNPAETVGVSLSFLTQLVTVDLSHNSILTVSPGTFKNLRNLKMLKLEGNKISGVNNKTFLGPSNLEVLSVKSNLIEVLTDATFVNKPKLKELELGKNRIKQIDDDAFKGLESLQILRLEDNLLSSVPSSSFRHLTHLAELHLAGNPLTNVSAGAFTHLTALTLLDLSSSRLSRLSPDSFKGLANLSKLKLADNNLPVVPAQSFKFTPRVESIDLGRNPFQTIPRNSFSRLHRLKHVYLSGCGRLESVESGAFLSCVNLEHVVISENRALVAIAGDAFDHATPILRTLDLSGNGLISLDAGLVDRAARPELTSLSLADNPWQCDCDLAPLVEAVKKLEGVIGGECFAPAAVRRTPLSSLAVAQLSCAVRHEPLGESDNQTVGGLSPTAVIVISCVAALLVVATMTLLFFFLRCRGAAPIRVPLLGWIKSLDDSDIGAKGGTSRHSSDQQYRQPSLSCDDDEHYYYVTTLQNRLAAGKHIPVTEL